MRERVTIGDVAQAAGVNASTASRALSNHPHVAAATRARILELAERMGYRPDPSLAALAHARWRGAAGSKGNVLALVNWVDGKSVLDEQMEGFRTEAQRLGYRVDVLHKADYSDGPALERVLIARGIRGIAVSMRRPGVPPPALNWNHFAVVQIGMLPDGSALADVCGTDTFGNHLGIMREALASGVCRPGVVLLEPRFMIDELRRLGGLEAAWAEAGHDDRLPVLWLDHGDAKAAARLSEWATVHELDAILGQTAWISHLWRSISANATVPHIQVIDLSRIRRADRVGQTAARLLAGKLQQSIFGLPDVPVISLVGDHVPKSSV